MRPIRIAVYGDINLNIIDGSAIWLASLTETVHLIDRVRLTLVRKAPERRDTVTRPLHGLERLEIAGHPSASAPLPPEQALDLIADLDAKRGFDIVLLRGFRLCRLASERPWLAGRMWTYLTDIPQDPAALAADARAAIARIAESSDRLLCQTEELRSYLESVVPEAGGKTILLPPMVPPVFARRARPDLDRIRRLLYAGKFAPRWGFLETAEQFARLHAELPDSELHVAGDKIHNPSDDPAYKPAVEEALRSTPGLVWHGGVTRERVAELLADADIALSARHPDLNDSLELSTKILEYGAAGVPVLLNRTAMHEALYGREYPLFIDRLDQLAEVVRQAISQPDRWRRARDRAAEVASGFSFERVAEQLRPHLTRRVPEVDGRRHGRPVRVLVASHSFKFFSALQDHIARTGAEVRVDNWEGHARHDEAASKDLLNWAEVIVCEWAVGNAVWYARNRKDHQRVLVRLHRMELETGYPAELDLDAVDRVVFVSEHFRAKARAQLGWDEPKLEVIPNWVDTLMLDRPKLPGARFHIGLLGWISERKRLDRALDVIERLAMIDPRFRLFLGGRMPWEERWVWQRLAEQQYFVEQLDRVRTSPVLRRAVSFDGQQHNVASWLRKIGYILSPSDDESFHLSPAEGMASRAVPAIWPWECADEVYDERWIYPEADAVADAVLALDEEAWRADAEAARAYIERRYALEPVADRWARLVLDL